jgi:hypothetical protein
MFIIKVTLDLTIKYTRHVHYKSFNSLYSSPLLNMPLLPKTTNQATPTKDHQSDHSHQRPPIRPLLPKTTNQATPTKDHQSDQVLDTLRLLSTSKLSPSILKTPLVIHFFIAEGGDYYVLSSFSCNLLVISISI